VQSDADEETTRPVVRRTWSFFRSRLGVSDELVGVAVGEAKQITAVSERSVLLSD